MIAKQELRIGNWVKQSGTRMNIQVDLFMFHEMYDHEQNNDYTYCDHLQPIPLTPALLELCEIKVYDDDNSYLQDEIRIWLNRYWYVLGCVENQYGSWDYVEREIEYLHQLQNIYFASTGEELTITL